MPNDELSWPSAKAKLGVILRPENLLKSVVSQIPFAGAAVEMANQIADHEADQRLKLIEEQLKDLPKVNSIEDSVPKAPAPTLDWSIAVAEYFQRTVDLAVVYDGGIHGDQEQDQELFHVVAHACIIEESLLLTCKEAITLAQEVAHLRSGKLAVFAGLAEYDVSIEGMDESTGLSLCRLGSRDEEKWHDLVEHWKRAGLGQLPCDPISTKARIAVAPWLGQEFGFLHTGEATNVMKMGLSITHRQFDTSVISHFRHPTRDSLKSLVTGVLPGRVLHVGAPMFARDGTLLGILSDTESYDSDAGRRAVGRSLLGHPHFMKEVRQQQRESGTSS